MAFSRGVSVTTTVAHSTTVVGADDPTKEVNKDQWNGTGAHTVAASGSSSVTDAVSGGIPFFSSTTAEGTSALLAANSLLIGGGAGAAPFTDSTNLLYTTASGPRLQVGSGTTTSAGFITGYSGFSGYGGVWHASLTPSLTNGFIYSSAASVYFQAPSGGAITIGINALSGGGAGRFVFADTAGRGPDLIAGTAVSNVAAETITQTWNNAACATGWKLSITDTTSAAGALAWQVLGGASGTTNLASLGKTGTLTLGALLVLQGYTVTNLPTGIDGAIAMVTDQLTTVAAKGVAPTGGGSVHCAVIYNGSAWVGI